MSETAIDILLLGTFEIRVHGRVLRESDIPGRKAPTLIKLIALARDQQLLRDHAIETLWPDLAPEKAGAQLYKAVHSLRKVLAASGPEGAEQWLTSSRDRIGLSAPGGVSTDADRFDRTTRQALRSLRGSELEAAAALYAGDLLPMDLYADWTQVARDQLRQIHVDLLLALGQSRHEQGDLAAAAHAWRQALENNATLEAAHRGLMEVFAAQGQRDRALKQYGLCMDALAEEFGVAPATETRELYERINRQRTGRTAAAVDSRQPLSSAAPLVGRSDERRCFDRLLTGLGEGRGARLALTGPAGIGKTRLVQELAARAVARQFLFLSGGASEMKGLGAYGPVIQLIQCALREAPTGSDLLPAEVAARLPGPMPDAGPVPNSDPRAAQTYLFAGIARFFHRRAEDTPLVLVLENLQDADADTIELIHYLGRELRDAPVLLVMTARTDPDSRPGTPLRGLLRGLERDADLTILDLATLSAAEQHQLLQRQRPMERERSDAIFRLARGNPLYALELQRFAEERSASGETAGADLLPPSLRAIVEDRVSTLGGPARELLTLAAIVGEDFDYSLLESLRNQGDAGGEPADLLDLIDELLTAQLIEERGLGFRFRHALFRQGIYETASRTRRRVLHARVARELVQLGNHERELPVEAIAWHYRAAGDARQAAHFLTLAGQRAAALYAHQDALARFREALALLEPMLEQATDSSIARICGQLHTLIGDTCRAGGYLADALTAYRSALDRIRDLPMNQTERTELHGKLALVAVFTTDMDEAGTQLAEAWACVPEDPSLYARLHILRALYLWHFNRLEEAAEYARRALTLAESADASLETAQACEILAMAYLPMGRWQEGLEYEKRRLQHGRWSPDLVVATDAHLCLWEYHIHDDNLLDTASGFMREVASEADRLGDVRCVAICHYALGTIQLWQGDTDAALGELDRSLGLHDQVGSPAGMAYALSRRAVLHTLENAIDLGWQSVCRGIESAERASIRDHCLQRLYGTGIWNRLQAGDDQEVNRLVALSEALLDSEGPCTACSLDLYPWLALHYLEQGDVDRAAHCAGSLNRLASKTGNPVGEAFAAIVDCGVARARGDSELFTRTRDTALQHMEKAVSRGSGSPMTWLFDRLTANA